MRQASERWEISAALAFAFVALSCGNISAQMGGLWPPGGGEWNPPAPRGVECFSTAVEAAKACKEAGGDFMDCSKACMDAADGTDDGAVALEELREPARFEKHSASRKSVKYPGLSATILGDTTIAFGPTIPKGPGGLP
jgi:hypothetical protein